MLAGLQAGAMGLPFMPVRGIIGTDYMQIRPDFKVIDNPYGEDKIVVVPAIVPDIALIHAKKADSSGNVLVDRFENDPLLARASKRVFVSCEEMVPNVYEVFTKEDIIIPSIYINKVVLLPGSARPTGCEGYYDLDDEAIRAYLKAAKDDASMFEYMDVFINR